MFLIVPQLYQNSLYIEKLFFFLNFETIEIEKNFEIQYSDLKFSLFMENINFKYKFENRNIVKDINIVINSGDKVALVGRNGSGKSTIIKLLLKLYEPDHGRILYNNLGINKMETKSYQSQFLLINQDTKLFSASIAENICLGIVDTIEKRNKVIQSLKLVGMYEKIKNLSNGIDTMVTKEFNKYGQVFSGGEIQKIVLARVFACDKKVYVLDEPTSALDSISEYNILENINIHLKHKTIIFVTHRLKSVMLANHILVIDNGDIVEQGTHEELIQVGHIYSELYNIQDMVIKSGDLI